MVARPSEARASSVTASRRLFALGAVAWTAGCATLHRLPAEPASLEPVAAPPISGCMDTAADAVACRFLVLRETDAFTQEARNSVRREELWRASQGDSGALPPASFLAISGGGDDGAFGAGLLVGWTEAGTRPEFKTVTGVSTGALIAPFAFLGPKYDDQLRFAYTQVSQRDIFKKRALLRGFFSDAMADTTPLYRLVERQVDRALLDAIAAEYAKGRLLLVGTTNLDSREPVIWNLTAIAASKDPGALVLFRKLLLASAAIPGAFPPVMIDVEVNGRRYQEMHVDGGAMAQVFAYPPSLRLADVRSEGRTRRLYIIRNARLDPEWASVERRTMPIATRAISALIQAQGVGDLYRIYLTTQRDDIDFNLAFIPSSFNTPRKEQFDTAYMRTLFKTGRDMAAAGFPWEKHPPGFAAPVRAATQSGSSALVDWDR
jgi:hypothetical protein